MQRERARERDEGVRVLERERLRDIWMERARREREMER